jgi:hypothetical protein
MGHKAADTAHIMHDSISDEYYERFNALPLVKLLSKPVEASHKSISTPIFKTVGQALQRTEKALSRNPQAKPTH